MAGNSEIEEIIANGLKNKKIEKEKADFDYYRVREHLGKLGHGTIIIGQRVIMGYPHIKRVFTLENGIRRNIGENIEIYVEEKIDGFNVRVVQVDGKIYGFSRGGFLDAFVTEKIRADIGIEKFFADNPSAIICGEMIGNTPHTKPTKDFDTKFFVFDIINSDGLVTCDERYEILGKYKIKGVPFLGKLKSNDFGMLKKIILGLNKKRKEGMVIKTADRSKAIKYVTAFSDIQDIAQNTGEFFDMPSGFYYQRILRSAIFIDDFGFSKGRHSAQIGKAFYDGLTNAIKNAKKGNGISEEFEITVKDEDIWKDILQHMSREVKIEEIWRKKGNRGTRIRFRKIYKKTSRILKSYLGGKGITD